MSYNYHKKDTVISHNLYLYILNCYILLNLHTNVTKVEEKFKRTDESRSFIYIFRKWLTIQCDATKDIWTGNPISDTVKRNKTEVDSRPCPSGIPLVVNLTCNRNDRGTIDESHRIDSYRKADARSKIRTRSHASIWTEHWLRA